MAANTWWSTTVQREPTRVRGCKREKCQPAATHCAGCLCSSARCSAAGCSPSPAHRHTGHKYWAGHAGLKHHGSSPAFAICAAAPHTPPCPQEAPAPSHSPCAPCTSPPRGSAFSHLRQFAAAAVCNLPCF